MVRRRGHRGVAADSEGAAGHAVVASESAGGGPGCPASMQECEAPKGVVVQDGLLAGGASCAAVQGGSSPARSPAAPPPAPLPPPRQRGRRSRRAARPPPSGPRQPPAPLAPEPLAGQPAPVGAFLTGKLLSHTVLGALLGIFGSALQPSPRVQAGMVLAAGLLMVLFALDLFGIKALGRLVPRAPASPSLRVAGRRSRGHIRIRPGHRAALRGPGLCVPPHQQGTRGPTGLPHRRGGARHRRLDDHVRQVGRPWTRACSAVRRRRS